MTTGATSSPEPLASELADVVAALTTFSDAVAGSALPAWTTDESRQHTADVCHALGEDPPAAASAYWHAKLAFGSSLDGLHEARRVGLHHDKVQAAFTLSEAAGDIVVATGNLAEAAGRGG